jgi:hypothetical protein
MTRHQQTHEVSPLIDKVVGKYDNIQQLELTSTNSSIPTILTCWPKRTLIGRITVTIVVILLFYLHLNLRHTTHDVRGTEIGDHKLVPTGPYHLVEAHVGRDFFSYYEFYNGSDSLGSAGFNKYVSQSEAEELGIVAIITEENEELVYLSSAPTKEGPRDSIRLEGKKRFERGLFILDVKHMPDGCGVWPAFWMTDEDAWPWNEEIDVLEGRAAFSFPYFVVFPCISHLSPSFWQVSMDNQRPKQLYIPPTNVICMHMLLHMQKQEIGSGSVSIVSLIVIVVLFDD